MTRQEMENIEKENAIKELKNLQINIGSSPDDLDNSPLYYALDWAIKALEKQSSEEDCINRKAAINVVHKYFMDYLKLNDDICLDGLRSLPSVTPQPFINKPCISEGVCREDKMQVLDKIRAEIVELTKCPYGTECLGANCPSNTDCMICGDHVLEILDKYKAESEE